MPAKAHKRSARSLRGGIGRLCALSACGLLAVPAFGGSAHAARLTTVAEPSAGSAAGAVQRQANALPLVGAGATVTPPPTVAVATAPVSPATAAVAPTARALSARTAATLETARHDTSPSAPASGVRNPPAVSAPTSTPAPSSAGATTRTLPRVTNATSRAPGEPNPLAQARSVRTIGVTRTAPVTTATSTLAVAARRVGRLLGPAGPVARTLTRGRPSGLPFAVAIETLSGPGAALSGADQASTGTTAASAAAAEALPGVLGGLVALGSLPLPVLPGPPGIAVPISAPGQFPAIAPTGLLPAQALAGTLATPWPVPLGSGVGGSLSGEFEAGLPSPWALAWTPARGVVLRGLSIASGARVARYDAAPASVPAGSGSGEVSGGSSSSAAGGTGFSLATLLVPAALLLLAVPRLMRRLSLSCEQSLATAFALIPERPG